ncbi:UNKNOWN [Stylonychia lemnae]|uniref:Uncharacterized protein n=1 Tax=Stylonychia lemnae TaxID=5949 RepID=A0A078AT05_STYLE|nr:UNKNOWN [Stylonychia lemnae]|eukprot:CDW85319.1 UNKNOWN [Stylonychia lemnae]
MLSGMTSTLILFGYFAFMIQSLHLLLKNQDIEYHIRNHSRFILLFEEYGEDILSMAYYPLFMIKRTAIAFTLIYLQNHPVLQFMISFNIAFTIELDTQELALKGMVAFLKDLSPLEVQICYLKFKALPCINQHKSIKAKNFNLHRTLHTLVEQPNSLRSMVTAESKLSAVTRSSRKLKNKNEQIEQVQSRLFSVNTSIISTKKSDYKLPQI